jgi:sialate O-acetylesterase
VLSFDHIAQGLQLKPGHAFAIADADGIFHWADVTLRDNKIWLSHPAVTAPVQLRYGHADNPDAVLYNSAGLPASPFSLTLN